MRVWRWRALTRELGHGCKGLLLWHKASSSSSTVPITPFSWRSGRGRRWGAGEQPEAALQQGWEMEPGPGEGGPASTQHPALRSWPMSCWCHQCPGAGATAWAQLPLKSQAPLSAAHLLLTPDSSPLSPCLTHQLLQPVSSLLPSLLAFRQKGGWQHLLSQLITCQQNLLQQHKMTVTPPSTKPPKKSEVLLLMHLQSSVTLVGHLFLKGHPWRGSLWPWKQQHPASPTRSSKLSLSMPPRGPDCPSLQHQRSLPLGSDKGLQYPNPRHPCEFREHNTPSCYRHGRTSIV